MTLEQIQSETKKDPAMQLLHNTIQNESWRAQDPALKSYYPLRGELCERFQAGHTHES